ncbi:hypothetical protein POM88_007945 [Heracleum sosnowskyi]|uniref:Uncharacterized protein n=1 Tax=Heracleum sosnowskyi TaxID=360622 RepID=A0AAD8J8Y7_9APIA|nr:hypothetical protein POM88_007945 [Heracleum sosnowskyi]
MYKNKGQWMIEIHFCMVSEILLVFIQICKQSDLEHALPKDRTRCSNELCTLIQSLQQLLFASSTTAQPNLSPRILMEELGEMVKANAELSAAVETVALEHCKKNEIVKHHSQEIALQRQYKELAARVRALQAS